MNMHVLKIVVFLLFYAALQVDSAKILGIFHFPSKSHHILGSTLLKGLAAKGHQVTMLSPFPSKKPIKNYEDIELTGMQDLKEEENLIQKLLESRNLSHIEKMSQMGEQINTVNHFFLNNTVVQDLMASNRKFDLIIQCAAWNDAYLGLAHHFGAYSIIFSTIGASLMTNGIMQNPAPYSYVPNIFLSFPAKMTFLQRVGNTLGNIMFDLYYSWYMEPQQETLRKQYFPTAPTVKELLSNVSLILLNSHFSIESTRPHVPGMIQIGGFHVEEPKELSGELKIFMDSATEGVIFFSLGSNVKSSDLPEETLQAIITTFANLPVKVLWKFEKDNFRNLPSNIKIGKWLPQKDILAHPNTKLFVSHGGLLSTTEAVYYGVPVVGIPIFGDQEANVALGVNDGYIVEVPFNNITEEILTGAIKEVLNNPKYGDNIRRRSAVLKDQPLKPLDNAIFWVEYVLRHNGAHHLKTSAVKLEWYQYYLLDVITFLVGIVISVLAVVYLIVSKVVKVVKRIIFKGSSKPLVGDSSKRKKTKTA